MTESKLTPSFLETLKEWATRPTPEGAGIYRIPKMTGKEIKKMYPDQKEADGSELKDDVEYYCFGKRES